MPKYYKSWDNFDENEAIKEIEGAEAPAFPPEYEGLTEEEIKEKEKEKFLKGTSGAKPNTQIVIKGGNAPTPQLNIEHMKKQGNSFFTSLEFEKAIEWYTKCLRMNPEDIGMKVVLYSNRAQWYLNLKNYVDANRDALSALRLDSAHVKSLFRYGTALYYLKKYKQAKLEFSNLLRVDPHNKNGQQYLRHTEEKLAKIKLEAYEKLYLGEIIGDSTSIGKNVIQVEEINLDSKLAQNTPKLADAPIEEPAAPQEETSPLERESKTEFLSKTDVSNIHRDKEEDKKIDDFIENYEEQEELKRLEQERKSSKKGKKKRGKRKKKSKESTSDSASKNDTGVKNGGHGAHAQSNTSAEGQTLSKEGVLEENHNEATSDRSKIKFAFGSNGGEDAENQKKVLKRQHEIIAEQEEESLEADADEESKEIDSIDLSNGHEIHEDRDTSPFQRKIREECNKIKENIVYNSEEEDLDIVKSEEGQFYSIRFQKSPSVRSILKKKDSEINTDKSSVVNFDLHDNEIRDFRKNDKLNTRILNQQLTGRNYNAAKNSNKKKGKKHKGKGKKRKNVDEEAESKRKMERAERKRKEIAEAEQLATKGSINFDNIEEMDVDDDFDFNDDLEVWTAPKTTKFHSETLMDMNNPFSSESPQQPAEENPDVKKLASSPKVGDGASMLFSEKAKPLLVEEVKFELDYEVPTKSAQLEADMRNMRGDLTIQRAYLQRIEPDSLVSIFSSSIELDTVLEICKAFSSGSKDWIRENWNYLINFYSNLSKIDRFGITIEFLCDDEKEDIYKVTTELKKIVEDKKAGEKDSKEETKEQLLEKLTNFVELFD